MKVNEILHEGPIWQSIKSGVSKLGTGIAGAQAGYAQSKAQREGQQRINKIAKDAEPNWFKTQAAYQQRNVTPAQMGQYLTQWARQWFDSPAIPEYVSVTKSPQVTPIGVRQYLKVAASYYVAPDLNQAPANDAQTTSTTSTGGTATQTATGQTHTAAATNPNQPTATSNVAPSNLLFQDHAAFKAEFDKYIAGLGGIQSNSTALQDALKSMWLALGGTKVESKKNNGHYI